MTKQHQMTGIILFVILVGFALRLYQIDQVAFRGDEAFTASYWVNQPLEDTLNNIATIDPHPPLAYALFRAWGSVFGSSEFSLRLLPTLINTIGIAAIFALGKRIGGIYVALLAALMWVTHPFLIWHAQDARNYAIWSGLSIISVWLGIRAIEKQRRIDWVLYIVAAIISAYIYYLELFVVASLNLYILIAHWGKWKLWRQWTISQVILAVSLAVWFIQPRLLTGSGYGGTTGQFVPEQLFNWFLPAMNFGRILTDNWSISIWLPLLIVIIASTVLMWRKQRQHMIFLLLLAIAPPLMLGLVSTKLHVFTPRYVLASIPAFLLIFALFVVNIIKLRQIKQLRYALTAVCLIGWFGVSGYSLFAYYTGTPKAPDWRILAEYLTQNANENDLVIQTGADASFGFYYQALADEVALPAEPDQPADEITSTLEQYSDEYESLWIVGKTFPDWSNYGVVEGWTESNMQLVRETVAADIPVRQYMNWSVENAELSQLDSGELGIFDEQIELVGTVIQSPEPTNKLFVWLYWQPIEQSDEQLKVFVHLIGEINPETGSPLWAQDDRFPQNGRINTTEWQVDTVYRDVYVLDVTSVPSGEYTLVAGLYDPATGNRSTTASGADSIEIGKIILE